MPTITVFTIDYSGAEVPNELEIGRDYVATCDAYGIVVIEDALRVMPGKEVGPFRDDRLTLFSDGRYIGIEYGHPRKSAMSTSDTVYLQPRKTAKGLRVMVIDPS